MLREARASEWIDALMFGYAHYKDGGVLPYEGALSDQSIAWIAAVSVIDFERGVIERARNEAIERQRKSEAAKAKAQRR